MIFYRRDADAKPFVDVAVAEFVDPVHQEHAARLEGHSIHGALIKSKDIVGFQPPFLLGGAGGVALFFEWMEEGGVASRVPGAVDEQILRNAAKKPAWIDPLAALRTARSARKDFLHQVGRLVGSRLATEKTEKRAAMLSIGLVELASACCFRRAGTARLDGRR